MVLCGSANATKRRNGIFGRGHESLNSDNPKDFGRPPTSNKIAIDRWSMYMYRRSVIWTASIRIMIIDSEFYHHRFPSTETRISASRRSVQIPKVLISCVENEI
jgi:hypothetical protein